MMTFNDIITSYVVGFVIALIQEAYKRIQTFRVGGVSAGKIRAVGLLLSVVASVLLHLADGSISHFSFSEIQPALREALLYFFGTIAAYYSAVKDTRLNFGGRAK